MDLLNRTDDPQTIFQMVLRSLESHREKKAEHDLLDQIAAHYDLKGDAARWAKQLADGGVAIDEFLKYTLALIGPFVEMVLDIYAFLRQYVSTTGGRTAHFRIDSEDLDNPWSFDVSKLPRQIEWISSWMDVTIEKVNIDWSAIAHCLGNDNGIFYARIGNRRLVQSLVAARRDGLLSSEGRAAGDRIHQAFLRATTAWYRSAIAELNGTTGRDAEPFLISEYLPSVDTKYRGPNGRVGIDLAVALGGNTGFADTEVFRHPQSGTEIMSVLPESEDRYAIESAVYFCALWGLDDGSFRKFASWFNRAESSVLQPGELDLEVTELADALVKQVNAAVTSTGLFEHERELTKRRLEILLLPYWKDRWFLYEVWTLVEVIRLGQQAGAELSLEGVTPIADPSTIGSSWSLPKQKARRWVARLGAGSEAVLVWFQRETERIGDDKHMEPDIRLTTRHEPYPDLAIVECKDRLEFAGTKATRVIESYFRGSMARTVWLVNYEADKSTGVRSELRGERLMGVVTGFRPREIALEFRRSLDELLREELRVDNLSNPTARPEDAVHYLIIDISGSMHQKSLGSIKLVRDFVDLDPDFVRAWSEAVWKLDEEPTTLGDALTIPYRQSREDRDALEAFARTLPKSAKLTVITDDGGRRTLMEGNPDTDYSIEGRRVEIIVV
jgi:hypothetical protein